MLGAPEEALARVHPFGYTPPGTLQDRREARRAALAGVTAPAPAPAPKSPVPDRRRCAPSATWREPGAPSMRTAISRRGSRGSRSRRSSARRSDRASRPHATRRACVFLPQLAGAPRASRSCAPAVFPKLGLRPSGEDGSLRDWRVVAARHERLVVPRPGAVVGLRSTGARSAPRRSLSGSDCRA